MPVLPAEQKFIIDFGYPASAFDTPQALWPTEFTSGIPKDPTLGTTFKGWADTSAGPEQDSIVIANNMNLYAIWTPLTVTVNFDGNGADSGSPGLASVSATYGSPVTLSGPGDLAKAGKSFGGWNTQTDGLGTTYIADLLDPSPFTVPTTLYAVWN